ncbi:MAG: bifunctional oligoribonuclease/PAP phosphatase NrnA [Bacillota bacterium]
MVNNISDVARKLTEGQRFLVTGHIMPDGDCVGSMLAIGLALERQGREVSFALPSPVPRIYYFLPGVDRIKVNPPPAQLCTEAGFDLVLIMDTSVPERLGELGGVVQKLRQAGSTTVLIDHHVSAVPYADFNYIDPGAAAVGEIVHDLLKSLGWEIDKDIADCLYVTVATDTGGFRFETTTAATHRRVAEFIEAGVNVREISLRIFEEKPLKSISAVKAALNTLELSPCGRVAWMTMDLNVAKQLELEDEHTDGVVNYGRSIKGVEVALFFREVEAGRVKVSFRSKNYVDVSRLAMQFGGGGHSRAAGALVEGNVDQVRQAVVRASLAALNSDAREFES